MSGEGGDLAARVAAYDLDERRSRITEAPLSGPCFDQLLAACRRERTVGVLAAAVASGALPAGDREIALTQEAHAEVMAVAVLLEQLLVRGSAVLTAAGVDHRVLKGSSFAHLDWPDPSMRTFNDIDLLVAGDSDVAVEAFRAVDCTRRTAEVSRGFDRRFGKGTTLTEPSGFEIDLHRTLAAGAFGLLIKRDELLDGPQALRIGGTQTLALGRVQRFVHACYHAALGGVRPSHAMCRDVGELALQLRTDEMGAAHELARSWGGQAVIARALVLATDLLGLPEHHDLVRWGRAYEPTRAENRRIMAYSGPTRSFARQALEGFRVLPSMVDRVSYARHLIFASHDHLAARDESAGRRLIHTARILVRRTRR